MDKCVWTKYDEVWQWGNCLNHKIMMLF